MSVPIVILGNTKVVTVVLPVSRVLMVGYRLLVQARAQNVLPANLRMIKIRNVCVLGGQYRWEACAQHVLLVLLRLLVRQHVQVV